MSNSVVFLLIAVGLSVLGATAVWLHGHPRRSRHRPNDLGETLRVLSQTQRSSGLHRPAQPVDPTVDPKAPAMSPRDPRRSREPRPGA